MKQDVLTRFDGLEYTMMAFGIFFTVFLIMLFWVLNKKRNNLYDHASHLPLDQGEE